MNNVLYKNEILVTNLIRIPILVTSGSIAILNIFQCEREYGLRFIYILGIYIFVLILCLIGYPHEYVHKFVIEKIYMGNGYFNRMIFKVFPHRYTFTSTHKRNQILMALAAPLIASTLIIIIMYIGVLYFIDYNSYLISIAIMLINMLVSIQDLQDIKYILKMFKNESYIRMVCTEKGLCYEKV